MAAPAVLVAALVAALAAALAVLAVLAACNFLVLIDALLHLAGSALNTSISQIDEFLGAALTERSKRLRGSPADSADSESGGGPARTDSESSAWAPSPELPPRISVDAEVSLSGQAKRKRKCSFTGVDRLNTPLSMASPSKAKPALPRCVSYLFSRRP